MNIGVVSRRFAKALLDFAKISKAEDKVYEEMKTLSAHYVDVPALRRAISNPVLERGKKLDLLLEAAGGKDTTSKETRRFFSLVLENKREEFLQFMAWSYIDLYREDKKILMGRLTTAVPSPVLVGSLERMARLLTHGSVELEQKINPSLIGGYIIELAGLRLDASVVSQLKSIKDQFIAKNRRIV